MFDIYRLFYFVEETGLLIQEKWYKATHPQLWERNLCKYSNEEPEQADKNIFEEISGESNPELLGNTPEPEEAPDGTKDDSTEYLNRDNNLIFNLYMPMLGRRYSKNNSPYTEDGGTENKT